MNRRGFLGFSLAAVGGVFMGRRWYQQGRGLMVPEPIDLADLAWPPAGENVTWKIILPYTRQDMELLMGVRR